MEQLNDRNRLIDIIKGIMILPIVVFHLVYRMQDGAFDIAVREAAYLSLSVFMLFSGYFYNQDNRIIEIVSKRNKKLLLPVIITMLALLALFGPYYILTHNYTLEMWFLDGSMVFLRPELIAVFNPDYTGGQLFNNLSPVWFIWTLAFSRAIFILVMKIVKTSRIKFILSFSALVIIGCITYVHIQPLPWSLTLTPLCAAIMMIGAALHEYRVIEKLSKINLIVSFLISAAACFIHYLIFINFGDESLYRSFLGDKGYISAAVFVFQVLFGGFAVLTLARLIDRIKYLNDAFLWIGRHTLVILLFHVLIGGLAMDAMHTYNKPGEHWYLNPLPVEVVIKSVISFVISLAGCFGLCALNDRLKRRLKNKTA